MPVNRGKITQKSWFGGRFIRPVYRGYGKSGFYCKMLVAMVTIMVAIVTIMVAMETKVVAMVTKTVA